MWAGALVRAEPGTIESLLVEREGLGPQSEEVTGLSTGPRSGFGLVSYQEEALALAESLERWIAGGCGLEGN